MIASYGRLIKVCKKFEQIENYDKAVADEENLWHVHHRKETDEGKSAEELISENGYYDIAPEELIFLTTNEHAKLHCNEAKKIAWEVGRVRGQLTYWRNLTNRRTKWCVNKVTGVKKTKYELIQDFGYAPKELDKLLKSEDFEWELL